MIAHLRQFNDFNSPCTRIGLGSEPQPDEAQLMARGGKRLKRAPTVNRRERVAKVSDRCWMSSRIRETLDGPLLDGA
jgi:hypothetical protein